MFSGFHHRVDAESWISSSTAPTFAAGSYGGSIAASTDSIALPTTFESSFGGTKLGPAPAPAANVSATTAPPNEHSTVQMGAVTFAQVKQVMDYTGKKQPPPPPSFPLVFQGHNAIIIIPQVA
jgi:hypothetical protein